MKIKENKVYFGDTSAEELIEQFGSPLYVYDYDTLVTQYNRLHNAFKRSDTLIYYACKANANLEIMKLFKELGAGIDAVSPGEVFLALKAGFRPQDILLTGTNVTRDDIEYTFEHNARVNIDNLAMVENNDQLYSGREVFVRLNPDIRAGAHTYLETGHRDTKFGILKNDLPRVIELLQRSGAKLVGLHQHIGSDITESEPLLNGLDQLLSIAREFDTIRFIDIGGGFKVKYYEDDSETDVEGLGAEVSEHFNAFCEEHDLDLTLILEPGKYLVSEAGYLLTTVQSVKRNYNKVIVGTDSGMNHLIRPALYHAYHEIVNATRVEGETEKVNVVGNICESADVFAKNRSLSRTKAGDVLCVKNVGSYGYSMASMYNARFLPEEILIQNGAPRSIRRRQTFKDLLSNY